MVSAYDNRASIVWGSEMHRVCSDGNAHGHMSLQILPTATAYDDRLGLGFVHR